MRLLVIALVVLAAACGSSTLDPAAPAPTPTFDADFLTTPAVRFRTLIQDNGPAELDTLTDAEIDELGEATCRATEVAETLNEWLVLIEVLREGSGWQRDEGVAVAMTAVLVYCGDEGERLGIFG